MKLKLHLLVLLLLGATSLEAQSRAQASASMAVDVPFDFMVEQFMFPAGSYTVTAAGSNTFEVQSREGREHVRFGAQPLGMQAPAGTPRLIFRHDDNGHYRLQQLWMSPKLAAQIPAQGTQRLQAISGSTVEVPAVCTNCQ